MSGIMPLDGYPFISENIKHCPRLTSDDTTSLPNSMDFYFYFYFETEGRHANVKAHEAVDHLVSFMSSRKEISQSESNRQLLSYDLGISSSSSSSLGSSWTVNSIDLVWLHKASRS
jgi:hypothetical protein